MVKRLEIGDPDGFRVVVDRDAEVPIGVQIAWALRAQIRDGRFGPSQRLPGLRDLAETTGVNINTVRAVYQRLEHEGLIDSRQGRGTFVAPSRHTPSTVGTIAGDAARRAHATGVDPREVAAALYVCSLESPGRPAPIDEAAQRRRQLRDQVASLERTLGELEAGHPGVASTTSPSVATHGGGSAPRLLDVDDLEHVRTSLVRRLAIVQTAIDALGHEDTSTDTDEATARQSEREAATTSRRAARSPKSRPRVKTRPAPAGT